MAKIIVEASGDGAWPDLIEQHNRGQILELSDHDIRLAAIADGQADGKPSAALRVDLASGQVLILEFGLEALSRAIEMLCQKYLPNRRTPGPARNTNSQTEVPAAG